MICVIFHLFIYFVKSNKQVTAGNF